MSGSGVFWSVLVRAPMVRIASPFLLGMAVGRYGTFPQAILAWSIPLFALLFGVLAIRRTAYAHRWLAGTAMTLLLFQMGAWRMEVIVSVRWSAVRLPFTSSAFDSNTPLASRQSLHVVPAGGCTPPLISPTTHTLNDDDPGSE